MHVRNNTQCCESPVTHSYLRVILKSQIIDNDLYILSLQLVYVSDFALEILYHFSYKKRGGVRL